MQYLSIPIAAFASCEFVGEDPVNRATWVTLLAYCAQVENGGRICGCLQWGDRRWQQSCKVTKEEVNRPSALIRWEGNDLVVNLYPNDVESLSKARRGASLHRWSKDHAKSKPEAMQQHETASCNSETLHYAKPDVCIMQNNDFASSKVREGKVREERERERDAGEQASEPEASPSVVIPPMTRTEFNTLAEMRAIPADVAAWVWDTHDARGWVDKHGQPIRKVEPVLLSAARAWRNRPTLTVSFPQDRPESAKQVNGAESGKDGVWAIQKRIEAIDAEMAENKIKGGMEAAFGFEWTDQKRRAHWSELKRTRDELRRKLTKVNGH
jgi:hypothetical protein